MSLALKPLSEIFAASGSERAGEKDYPVMSITMKHGVVDQSEKFKKRIASNSTNNYRVVRKNELVVGFPIDEGVIGFQTKYSAGIVSPAYGIWRLIEPEHTHIPYLEKYLRSPQARNLYASKMQGAVARRRSLKKDDFLALKIPFPSFDDQIRIATLLSRVESLIASRKESLRLLDDFLKSTFFEMFGDPVRNERGWRKIELGKLLSGIDSGWSPKCEAREADVGEWGVLKLGAVTKCVFYSTENKALPGNLKPKISKEVKQGDLLFSRKNTYELVAASAYVFDTRERLMMSDLIFRLVIKDSSKLNPIFLWKLLVQSRQRQMLQKLAGGAAGSMPNISKQKLRTVKIPVPPLELQSRFSTIVEKVELLKSHYQKNYSQLESLYGALSQKAFKGDLNLTHIDLPTANDVVTEESHELNAVGAPVQMTVATEYPMSDSKAREGLLHQLFISFVSERKGSSFTTEAFLQQAHLQTLDHTDENSPPIGLDDYEKIKQWLFDLIDNQTVEQTFNAETNQVELKVKG
ncbi:MAG: restriction endonuclease subunit S [Candidatus Sedimenticola sp. (ex Thyasira tokunagai)]